MARRIHVMGASGSGTSTLARGLANAFDSQAFDTDDFTSWGTPILPRLTHVVFLVLPGAKRLARLRKRERLRADPELTRTPEWQAANAGFLDWAMSYDDPGFRGRSRAAHERWLDGLAIPVIRIDASAPADKVLAEAVAALDPARGSA
jgi:hypothetical protein